MNRERFVAQMGVLAVTLPPRKPLEDAALEGYWVGLEGMSDAELSRGVARALRECEYLPPPVELRRLAKRSRVDSELEATNAKILQLRAWRRGAGQ